ncbi:MAG TPA: 5-(carboxyamino)imidazole ribonucleotide synthase [Rubrivivax sp.]
MRGAAAPDVEVPGAGGVSPALGVLGGGQLGRMFVHAAQTLGFRTVVLDPDTSSPAGAAADEHLRATYLDPAALAELAARCVAVTTEFENVPADALAQLAAQRPVSPSAAAVSVCQHRAREKAHFARAGVPCARYLVIEHDGDLAGVDSGLLPGILKTASLGYDGKGQVAVETRAELAAGWEALRRVPCVLEQRVPLQLELSVIVARSASGRCVHLPVQQNLHRAGVLSLTQVPAPDVPAAAAADAVAHATAIAESLDYVGVLCVEFFLLRDGTLLANEMAPRPHNSGHYSIDACDLSQFDLQVRTMAGLPLVAPRLHSPAVMLNLLGDLWFDAGRARHVPDWAAVLALPGVHLHLYGKTDARPGRKMGHVTVTAASAEAALAVARQAAALLGIAAF